jgi:hypothetical protein
LRCAAAPIIAAGGREGYAWIIFVSILDFSFRDPFTFGCVMPKSGYDLRRADTPPGLSDVLAYALFGPV